MLSKRLTALCLLTSTLALSLAPAFSTPVQAQFFAVVSDPILETIAGTAETHKTIREVATAIALGVAQAAIEHIAADSIKWAQSGFQGNPAYVTNSEQYFANLADGIAGNYIKSSKNLAFLCSPFQQNIKLSLINEYYQPQKFQCTLTGVVGNIEDFYNDFSKGGWDAWFSMTQNPTNNPYGAYVEAKIDFEGQIASAVGLKNQELDRNQGFLSWKTCPKQYQITAEEADQANSNDTEVKSDGTPYQAGDCISENLEVVNTPGTVIKDQVDKVLPAGLDKLVNASTIEQVVVAFAAGILQRYVFGPKGLFAGGDTPSFNDKPVDIDGDGIPDGIDNTGDGQPDICYYGGVSTPSGPPCRGSHNMNTDVPPYLPPSPGGPGGGGNQCTVSGQQYDSALEAAEQEMVAANPELARLPAEGAPPDYSKANSRQFLNLVAQRLQGEGYNATTEVLNGNNNPNTGDLIAIWKDGDPTMERYDAMAGGSQPISQAVQAGFTGFIPLTCTPSGGSKDCGCKSNTGGGGPTPNPVPTPPVGSSAPTITTVLPTSVTAGQTTLAIQGSGLTATVQFFDGTGARYTVTGTLSSTATEVDALVPASLPTGSATVKVYRDASNISNGKLIQVTGSPGGGSGTSTNPPITPFAQKNLGPGVFPDVLFANGKLYVATKQADSFVTLYESSYDLSDIKTIKTLPLIGGDNSFPRLTFSNGVLWLAYRDGFNLQLWRSDTGTVENLGPTYGNDPVALGQGMIAWQNTGTYQIVRRPLTGGTPVVVKTGVPTGLNRILPSGDVVTTDQTIYGPYNVSWGTRPWVAGSLTLAEGQTSDLGRWNGDASSQFSIFSGISNTPHAATDGAGTYAVATWGGDGVRIAVIKH